MNFKKDGIIFDIIFLAVVFILIGNVVYHSFNPRGIERCERLSAGDNYTYNAFDGCIINGVKQWKVILNYQH